MVFVSVRIYLLENPAKSAGIFVAAPRDDGIVQKKITIMVGGPVASIEVNPIMIGEG